MSHQIVEESNFFLYSVCMGFIISFIYDMIRLVRNLIPHNSFFISIEDILFWIFTSLVQFLLLYKVNNGMIRWYSIAGALLGMMLYIKSVGQYMVSYVSHFIKKILHVVRRILVFVISPLKLLLEKTKPVFMRIVQNFKKSKKKVKNKLTGKLNRVKISLCKRNNPKDKEVEL